MNTEYILDITDKEKCILLDNYCELTPTEELAKELNTPYFLLALYSNCVLLNGQKYFLKTPYTTRQLISELLGEQLSKFMSLKTVEYKLLYDENGIVGLISKNFRKKDTSYVQSYHLTKEELEFIRNTLISSKKTVLKDELTRYILRNFYAASIDVGPNVLCERKNSSLCLAPLYDYSESFTNVNLEIYDEDDLFRDNSDRNLSIDTNFISKLISNPDMMEHYKKILSFDIEKTLQFIEENNGILIPSLLKDTFLRFDEKRKKLMIEKIRNL